jgi:hypothetical protein
MTICQTWNRFCAALCPTSRSGGAGRRTAGSTTSATARALRSCVRCTRPCGEPLAAYRRDLFVLEDIQTVVVPKMRGQALSGRVPHRLRRPTVSPMVLWVGPRQNYLAGRAIRRSGRQHPPLQSQQRTNAPSHASRYPSKWRTPRHLFFYRSEARNQH